MAAPPGYPQEYQHNQPLGAQAQGAQQNTFGGSQQQPLSGHGQQYSQQPVPSGQVGSHQHGTEQYGGSFGKQPTQHQSSGFSGQQQQHGTQQQGGASGGGLTAQATNLLNSLKPGHGDALSAQTGPSAATSGGGGFSKKLLAEGKKLVSQYKHGLKPPVNGHAGPPPGQGQPQQQHSQFPQHSMQPQGGFQQQQQQYGLQQGSYLQQQQQQYGQQQGGYPQQQDGSGNPSHQPQGYSSSGGYRQ